MQRLAGDVGRAFGGEEGDDRGDFLDLADAAHRGDGFDPGAHLAFVESGRGDAFGHDHAGIDRVGRGSARGQLLRQHRT